MNILNMNMLNMNKVNKVDNEYATYYELNDGRKILVGLKRWWKKFETPEQTEEREIKDKIKRRETLNKVLSEIKDGANVKMIEKCQEKRDALMEKVYDEWLLKKRIPVEWDCREMVVLSRKGISRVLKNTVTYRLDKDVVEKALTRKWKRAEKTRDESYVEVLKELKAIHAVMNVKEVVEAPWANQRNVVNNEEEMMQEVVDFWGLDEQPEVEINNQNVARRTRFTNVTAQDGWTISGSKRKRSSTKVEKKEEKKRAKKDVKKADVYTFDTKNLKIKIKGEEEVDEVELEEEEVKVDYPQNEMSDEQKNFARMRAIEIEKEVKLKAEKNKLRAQKKQAEKEVKWEKIQNACKAKDLMYKKMKNNNAEWRKAGYVVKENSDIKPSQKVEIVLPSAKVEIVFAPYTAKVQKVEKKENPWGVKVQVEKVEIGKEKQEEQSWTVVKRKEEKKVEMKEEKSEMKKSRFCNTFLKGEKCERRCCGFAHSESEIHPVACSYHSNCKKGDCYFIHPEENVKMYCDRMLGRKVEKVVKIEKVHHDETKCTRYCRNVLKFGKCNRSECTFAHTMEQYNPVKCDFGKGCKKQGCTFIHPHETKESHCKRVN
jgi:hypothetical protein